MHPSRIDIHLLIISWDICIDNIHIQISNSYTMHHEPLMMNERIFQIVIEYHSYEKMYWYPWYVAHWNYHQNMSFQQHIVVHIQMTKQITFYKSWDIQISQKISYSTVQRTSRYWCFIHKWWNAVNPNFRQLPSFCWSSYIENIPYFVQMMVQRAWK